MTQIKNKDTKEVNAVVLHLMYNYVQHVIEYMKTFILMVKEGRLFTMTPFQPLN